MTGVVSLLARISPRAGLIDLLMDRLEEMLRFEKVRDAVEGFIVDQDCTQQRLLRLDIMRGDPKLGAGGLNPPERS